MPDLQRCDACGKLSRNWSHVALDVDGFHHLTCKLCRACASHVEDAVKVAVKERELAR